MATEKQLRGMVAAIHALPELYGCRIVYLHHGKIRVLHEGMIPARAHDLIVVIEEGVPGVPRNAGSEFVNAAPTVAPGAAGTNASRLGSELVGLGLSCGFATISIAGVIGGAAAEVHTLGGSTVLLVLGWTGAVTAGAQCLNGVLRVGEIIRNPGGSSLDDLEKEAWYRRGMLIVDFFGIAAGLTSIPFAMKNLAAVLERQGGMVAIEKVTKMDPWQRKVVIEKAVKEASRTEAGRKALSEAMVKAGLKENQVASALRDGLKSKAQIEMADKAIQAETAKRLNANIQNLYGAGGGFGASLMPSAMVGSASGSVNWIVVHVFKAVKEHPRENRGGYEKVSM